MFDISSLSRIIDLIIAHYESLGGYRWLPKDPDDYVGNASVALLDMGGVASTGYYHFSLTVDQQVLSSASGLLLVNQSVNAGGLYYIKQSEGYDNARIVAHVGSWNGNGRDLYAHVAKW